MKVTELLEAHSGADKAAFKLGKATGADGKPSLSKATVTKSHGPDAWAAYSDGYREGKDAFQAKDDSDAWREKNAAKRTGRKYHE